MFGEKFGNVFDRPLSRIVKNIPLSPNVLTISGFVLTVFACYVLLSNLLLGGLLILAGAMFDILDGVVARTNGKSSRFGAFLDSVLDRYSDALIMMALSWHFLAINNKPMLLACLGILIGSFLVSYARARAEGLGLECKSGMMERPERIALIVFGTVTAYIIPTLLVLLILTNFTALQRIFIVWKITSGRRT